jgi:hypothetical protein
MNENTFGGSWMFAFLIIAILFGGGNLFGRGDDTRHIDAVVNSAVNNQSTQAGLRDVLLSSANNNYETLQAINNQTLTMMSQNNTNLINAIQGFNTLGLNMAQQNAELRQQIAQLGYQMETCCCSIKTQMLQDKYDQLLEKYHDVKTDESNNKQSQYLLSVMGKWIANPAATAA